MTMAPQSMLRAAVLGLLVCAAPVRAESITFPADAGVIDLSRPPYGAVGDGTTDCTAAIQKAFNDHPSAGVILYLPNGTYIVSDTIAWAGTCKRNVLQGQSMTGTVLRLVDRAAGFGDSSQPKAVVYTGTFPPQRFRNAIRNLTVDTGRGNPGAIGMRFNASNQGQVHAVTIRSGDGSGPIGLDMSYCSDVGPLLVKNLHVVGFDVGIATACGVAGQVFEHITLENQNVCGFVNDGQAVSMRGLTSRNQGPAIYNKAGSSFLTLLDAECEGQGAAAIRNDASLFARNVRVKGYALAIDGRHGGGADAAGPVVDEYVSQRVLSLFPSPARSLGLPVQETPEVPWDDPATWVPVTRFPPKPYALHEERKGSVRTSMVDDYTESFQQAIDSGATTIYVPRTNAELEVFGTVHIRGRVRRIIGLERPLGRRGHGTFVLDDGEAPVVVLERFDWIYAPITVRTASKRTLVVSATPGGLYDIGPDGTAFFEDVVAELRLQKGARVWMRQFNTEYTEQNTAIWGGGGDKWSAPGNLNDGGQLWILGIKTEGDGTLITTRHGGKTELLGGLVYANKNYDPNKKMFVNDDSSLAVSVGEFVTRGQPFHPVVEIRDGVTKTMPPGFAPGRCGGSQLTLYTGYRPTDDRPAAQDTTAPASALGPVGAGTGLHGDYYAHADFTGQVLARTDAGVDFDWTRSAPAPGLAAGKGAVRWTGQIEPRVSGPHGFTIEPDGARLLIDGRVVVDAWPSGTRYRFGKLRLDAGRRYNLVFEYRAAGAGSKVQLRWNEPGLKGESVPASQLYPVAQAATEVTLAVSTNLLAEGGRADLTLTRTGDLAAPLTVALAPRVDLEPLARIQWANRGNAVAGVDYPPLPETFTFAAGQARIVRPLAVLAGRRATPDRRLVLDLAFAEAYRTAGGPQTLVVRGTAAPAAP